MIEVERTIRSARLTDRQALADLSRRVHASHDAHRRSLGVPAPSTDAHRISLSTLIPSWLPLRAPSVHLVAEIDGELVGSCRAIEEPHRDDWVITELDAAEATGFEPIGRVTMLVREVRAQVRQPAMVPAIR